MTTDNAWMRQLSRGVFVLPTEEPANHQTRDESAVGTRGNDDGGACTSSRSADVRACCTGLLAAIANRRTEEDATALTTVAAEHGHLECLKLAHRMGVAWDGATCARAAANGHLDCLRYARENGCPWNESVCENAALNGHLECLRYARENGCPIDAESAYRAAGEGRHGDGCGDYLDTYVPVEYCDD